MSKPQITIGKNGKVTVNGTTYESVNDALTALANKASGQGPLSAKASPKTGVLCVYGLQRRPVSLYKQQWERLLSEFDANWLNLPGLSQGKDDPRFHGPATSKPEPEGYDEDDEPTDEELSMLARLRRARKAE